MNDLSRLQKLARALKELKLREERDHCEADFKEFVRQGWSSIENVPYEENWALDALCDHLQAVTRGHVRRMLANYPPRCAKTNITSVLWPVWTWIQLDISYTSGPQVKFVCASYGSDLSLKIADKCLKLLTSPWFQERWGRRVKLLGSRPGKEHIKNTAGGERIASSVGGSLLGIGYDVGIADDLHNTNPTLLGQSLSEAEREAAITYWAEFSTTRQNDPRRAAIVAIMQRMHEEDVSGHIIKNDTEEEWVWFNVPMEYDPGRHCVTGWIEKGNVVDLDGNPVGAVTKYWEDPRQHAGDLMWPGRFSKKLLQQYERELGPYMYSGRYQQDPTPSGGGILKKDWWLPWKQKDWPLFEFILASLDTAHTEKQENDPSAMTVWGVYQDENGRSRVMLMDGWAEHLEFHDLVTKVAKTCKSFKVDRLLVEAKANGMAVAQEIRRLHSRDLWSVEEINPGMADKVARVHSVVPLFADGVVTAPQSKDENGEYQWRDWAAMVIKECAAFPKGKHDDLVDTCSMGLRYLRSIGLAEIGAELVAQFEDSRKYRSPKAGKLPYQA